MSPFENERNKKSKLARIGNVFISTRCMMVCSVLLVVLGATYVIKTNAVSGEGYDMKELERSIRTLQHETQTIELEIAGLTASKQLRAKAERLGFSRHGQVHYIATTPSVVARR